MQPYLVRGGYFAAALASAAAGARRGLAVSARLQDWSHAAAIPHGSTLSVTALHSDVSIGAASGADSATIKGSQASMETAWKLEVQPNPEHPKDPNAPPTLRLSELASSAKGTLFATIPDKWVSVAVTAGEGSVHVAKVAEAHLSISTKGGRVELGNIRAINTDIRTLGGALQGTELSGTSVVVDTQRGPISLRRLLGQEVSVRTKHAPVEVGALYADDVFMQTDEGSVHIGTMDCSAEVRVASKGGDIRVDSLDGNAHLQSDGGQVQVHLHSKIGNLRVDSKGGDVSIAISPEANVALVVNSNYPVQNDGAADFITTDGQVTAHFRPQATPGSKEPRWGMLSEGSCVVNAGDGRVTVTRLRWADAVRARLGKAQAAK